MKRPSPQDEAAAWVAKLSQPCVTTTAIHEFFAWRRRPANLAAFEAASRAHRRKTERFRVERDARGFSVIDIWTGEPAIFATCAQAGIPEADAEDIADILNRRALRDAPTAQH